MKASFSFLLLVLAILILLNSLSCNKEPNNPAPQSGITPLAVGNYWEYLDSTFTDSIVYVGASKKGISGWREIEFDGTAWTVFEYSSYYPGSEETVGPKWLYTNDPDFGLRCFGGVDDNETFLVNNLQVLYPAISGQRWESLLLVYNGTFDIWDTIHAECIDTNQIFSTPAGDFECYVFSYEWPTIPSRRLSSPFGTNTYAGVMTVYYAPNVGLVGTIWSEEYSVVTVSRLEGYNLE
ncbi:hypothetical protein KAH81_05795 [bacterium]|nr:hypothetical protein [bacterium]